MRKLCWHKGFPRYLAELWCCSHDQMIIALLIGDMALCRRRAESTQTWRCGMQSDLVFLQKQLDLR